MLVVNSKLDNQVIKILIDTSKWKLRKVRRTIRDSIPEIRDSRSSCLKQQIKRTLLYYKSCLWQEKCLLV